MTQLRNEHLSFSRLTRYESCPLSYSLHYVEKQQAEPGIPLRFGKVIHAVLERLLRRVIDEERVGPLSEVDAIELLRETWTAESLTGIELFQEGVEILRRFVREQGVVDHRDVIAVEKEFEMSVGPFKVVGFIDRVNAVDDQTIEIIDYKSNHQLFAREEVDSSLQMSLYNIAARQLWPWAKKVKLSFWMLRHGIRQETERTPEQLDAALAYVETLGRQIETATEFPARLNANCPYCDHRAGCPAYAEALGGKRAFVCQDLADLEAVAKEREEVARLAKVLHARKEELERILKTHLQDKDELVLGGMKYRMFNNARLEYPLAATIEKIGQATGRSWSDLVGELAVIDKKSLDGWLKVFAKQADKSRVMLLKAELEAGARKTFVPRFWAAEVAA
ncbi:MAG: PD-(D/E)XK nuclease family protein [Pseudomonadota bacterium]